MTPEKKAWELIVKFATIGMQESGQAKKCALIMVDEILKSEKLSLYFESDEINTFEITSDDFYINNRKTAYWKKVKTEINKH
jgi:hypothetical protein